MLRAALDAFIVTQRPIFADGVGMSALRRRVMEPGSAQRRQPIDGEEGPMDVQQALQQLYDMAKLHEQKENSARREMLKARAALSATLGKMANQFGVRGPYEIDGNPNMWIAKNVYGCYFWKGRRTRKSRKIIKLS